MSLSINNTYNSYNNANVKTNSYFESLTKKYPNVNLYQSTSPVLNKNQLSVSVSPAFIAKASNNAESAEHLNYLLDQMVDFPQYVNTHYLNGPGVKSVAFTIDENGDMRCAVDLNSSDSNEKNNISGKTKDDKIKLKEKIAAKKQAEKRLFSALEKNNSKSDYIVNSLNTYNTISVNSILDTNA